MTAPHPILSRFSPCPCGQHALRDVVDDGARPDSLGPSPETGEELWYLVPRAEPVRYRVECACGRRGPWGWTRGEAREGWANLEETSHAA